MKLFKYYTILLMVSIFLVLASCTDTFELTQKYLKDGETIYTNKVDSLSTYSGKKRIKIAGYISNAFNVTEIVVYWNKGKNSQTFPYAKSTNSTDKLELIVTNIEEGSHQFDVYSKDANGNKSVVMTAFGVVYGDTYQSTLEARSIGTFALNSINNSASVSFNITDANNPALKPIEKLTRTTEIKYTNTSDVEVIKTIAAADNNIILDQIDINKPVVYRTFYVPTGYDDNGDETTIDEFASNWKTYTYPVYLKTVLDNLTIVPAVGGIQLDWTNPTKNLVNINVGYTASGAPKVLTIQSNLEIDSRFITGISAVQQTVNVTTTDSYGNSCETNAYSVKPLKEVKLVKTLWSIVDFDSQEPAEATTTFPNNGLAISAIDGNINTYWESALNPVAATFPHWFTIDLGSEKTITRFGLVRRQNVTNGATAHEFWVSNDNVTWTKVMSYNSALTTNGEVSVFATANTNPKGRYVKYLATAGPNAFTHLAELNIYGAE
jgi:hypothetical protein